jgi:hypothetical protein
VELYLNTSTNSRDLVSLVFPVVLAVTVRGIIGAARGLVGRIARSIRGRRGRAFLAAAALRATTERLHYTVGRLLRAARSLRVRLPAMLYRSCADGARLRLRRARVSIVRLMIRIARRDLLIFFRMIQAAVSRFGSFYFREVVSIL